MRRAITIGIRHGKDLPEIMTGPDMPLKEHTAGFKKLRETRSHPDFQRVEIWHSDSGLVRKARFLTPDGAVAAEAKEAAEKAQTAAAQPKPKPAKPKKEKPAK